MILAVLQESFQEWYAARTKAGPPTFKFGSYFLMALAVIS